jgi:VanZ family protein
MTSKVIKSWLPVIIWAAIIFLFSANPDPYTILPETWRVLRPLPTVTNFSMTELIGQIMHFVEYAILSILILRAITHSRPISRKSVLLTILLTMIYAFSDEIHQTFIPGRTFQLFDLFIDLLGAITGSFVYKRMLDKLEQ